jgi:hypothetical protein
VRLACLLAAGLVIASGISLRAAEPSVPETEIDRMLARDNADRGVKPTPVTEDLAFLRRASVDLIGRIPTEPEIQQYLALPSQSRREQTIDRLLQDERFLDRWSAFFADMLRIRTNRPGGAAFLAYVRQSLEAGVPYDEMARDLLRAQGRAGNTPELGYLLGDDVDPMALAGATSQTFLGVRIACAQCHDHPFDVWKRRDFYDFAAYFGKTRRVESELTNVVYTTEERDSRILWPPEGEAEESERRPIDPRYPFALEDADGPRRHIARLTALRTAPKEAAEAAGPSIDDLFAAADNTIKKETGAIAADPLDVSAENARQRSSIDLEGDLYRSSQWRMELAEKITAPENRYFARNFVNRVWAELLGRGIVEPVDDFSEFNGPSHPETLDYLADEFVAHGYDVAWLIREIVSSRAYQRRPMLNAEEAVRMDAEAAFAAAPLRRMLSESLYDSIVVAGHLFDKKHPEGANNRVTWEYQRVAVRLDSTKPEGTTQVRDLAGLDGGQAMPAGGAMNGGAMAGQMAGEESGGYDLEQSLELDFAAALQPKPVVEVDAMRAMSNEEIEAARMVAEAKVRYLDRYTRVTYDDNPQFGTAFRMPTPQPPEHFLRIFGQPGRDDLGDRRDPTASMRQSLMMLNGRMVHEAARVGALEPISTHLEGDSPDLAGAIRLAYREILTREPSTEELAEAREIVSGAETPLDGVADLRWVLFNCHEFRFLP